MELPSYTEWFNYMMFVSTAWCGPMLEFSVFKDFIERQKDSNVAKMPHLGNWPAAWKRFAEVWLCAIGFSILAIYTDINELTAPEFKEKAVWYKIFVLCMSM